MGSDRCGDGDVAPRKDFCVNKPLHVHLSTGTKGTGGGVFLGPIMIVVDKTALKYTISLNGKHTESFYHYIWPRN